MLWEQGVGVGESDLSASVVSRAISPFSQVPGSEGIHELGSSAQALLHTLEESASLLTMFWRAALPSSLSPALSGNTVSGSLLHRFCPKCHSASSVPQVLKVRSQRVELGQRGLRGLFPEEDLSSMLAAGSTALMTSLLPPPAMREGQNMEREDT